MCNPFDVADFSIPYIHCNGDDFGDVTYPHHWLHYHEHNSIISVSAANEQITEKKSAYYSKKPIKS